MITVTDKNREDIIRVYAHDLLDSMDFDTLYSFAYETLVEQKSLLDNEPLEQEILELYPDILSDSK